MTHHSISCHPFSGSGGNPQPHSQQQRRIVFGAERISNPNFGPQVYSQHNVDTSALTCAGWPRGERTYSNDMTGATDGGSSGSPVVNGSSQIVGQLSGCCGYNCADVCDSASNSTVDGAFAYYYASVKPYLNP